MKCACCEREIKENEKFYELEDEFYCDSCVEEGIATYYVVGGETHDEEEVGCYRNRDGFIQNIEKQIEFHKRVIDVYSVKEDDFEKSIVETAKKKFKN
ncbi:hypothetical protein [Fusobacterium necrophorum]|uniref:hypothetical protein n=1 Tax=Fusobacterium necrophorum TaxID=859 RepID=UPI00370E8FA1